ncbi:aECM cysteine-cradle domain-containing protein [Caenorhabditis elegans]|uniref:AECM cysteine-cradle domain-containing protein n=1 Tax=Caenorhabditis elegans TaxID=6239 RepID=O44189_CAEEL|nr:Titin [Caenorhabditis elegans]CCD63772.1 Titin [Caenorhabditis elegans]|eukprot:NP_501260.2 Uncharacterized protein CELE_F33D4.6 [Caenorhabditis elegans]
MRHLFVLLPALLAITNAQDHSIDIRALVRDTIDAIKEVPEMMKNQNQTSTSSTPDVSTPQPEKVVKAREDVYDSLLKLPSDIMSQLARDAGFVSEKDQKIQKNAEVSEKKKEETERVEKKKEDDESFSFKTVDDVKKEERKEEIERPSVAAKADDNEDIFSISRLISATGNAIREAQAAQAAQKPQQTPQQEPMITLPPLVPLPPVPLQMPALHIPTTAAQPVTEIMYRPVTRDGKTVYEQVVVLKEANGSVKILPNTLLQQLPEVSTKRVEIKQVKSRSEATEFLAPTFPPMINLFTDPTTTTTPTTTEEPEVTTIEEVEQETIKPKRKSLPRRKIHYLEKKGKDMHSRQFGAKTVQMSDPIDIQAQEEQEPVNILQKENEKVEEKPVEEEEEATTEPPKKKRKMRKSHKTSKKEKKEIRKFPDLYDEQWKTQVAPSVSPPSEEFAEQFDGVDEVQESPKRQETTQQEVQNDTPMNDAIEQRSSKVQMLTKEQEEELLNKEVRKRVMKRIRLSKMKTTTTTTTTEAPTTTPEEEEEEVVTAAVEQEEEDDVIEAEELVEDEEEDVTTTTTTEAPVTRAQRVKKNKKRAVVTKHQCLNLRSFARQFLFDTVEEFAKEHCYFIENYYPALTCARSHAYVAKCQKWLKEE